MKERFAALGWFTSDQSRRWGKVAAAVLAGGTLLAAAAAGPLAALGALAAGVAIPVGGAVADKLWTAASQRFPEGAGMLRDEAGKVWRSATPWFGAALFGAIFPGIGLPFLAAAALRGGVAIHGAFADRPELGFPRDTAELAGQASPPPAAPDQPASADVAGNDVASPSGSAPEPAVDLEATARRARALSYEPAKSGPEAEHDRHLT